MRLMLFAGLLLAPAVALAQDATIMPAFPIETVHSDAEHYVETIHAVGTGWLARGSRPQDYQMGTVPTDGSLEPEAFVIRARPEAQIGCPGYGTMMQIHAPGPFLGRRLKLSARLKTSGVAQAHLFLRVDGGTAVRQTMDKTGRRVRGPYFYNMDDRPVQGTTDWHHFAFVLDVPDDATAIAYGFFLTDGQGTAWMDGLTLETVDKDVPITQVGPNKDLCARRGNNG